MRTDSPHNQLISRCIYSYYDTIIKNSKITVTQYYNDNKKTVTRYIRERYAEQFNIHFMHNIYSMTALHIAVVFSASRPFLCKRYSIPNSRYPFGIALFTRALHTNQALVLLSYTSSVIHARTKHNASRLVIVLSIIVIHHLLYLVMFDLYNNSTQFMIFVYCTLDCTSQSR